MPRNIYFVQECPTCGRNLQVRVEYLGKKVVCQHCSAKFVAAEAPSPGHDSLDDSSSDIMQRAEELLQSAMASGIGLPRE